MPEYPTFPRDENDDRAPTPQEIVDRIIHGRLGRIGPPVLADPDGH
ncbi:hypothetical protein [Halomicrobium urmianum]|nr:hypothetical protein [Halomicrobium urmianum]